MKIALCLYGHFRTFETCFSSLKDNLLDLYPMDVFAMTWGDSKGNYLPLIDTPTPTTHPGYDLNSPGLNVTDYLFIIENLKPKGLQIENFNLHKTKFENLEQKYSPWNVPFPNHRTIGMFGMNWARKCSIQLKKDYEKTQGFKYDLVIATRWDALLTDKIDIATIEPNCLNMPRAPLDNGELVNRDELIAGPSYFMDIWGNQFDAIKEFARLGYKEQEPHKFTEFYLLHYSVPFLYNTSIGVKTLR